MSTFFWWVGDVLLIAVAFPTVVVLLARIIRPLRTASRAISNIGRSSRAITSSLPGAVSELSTMAEVAQQVCARTGSRT